MKYILKNKKEDKRRNRKLGLRRICKRCHKPFIFKTKSNFVCDKCSSKRVNKRGIKNTT